MKAVLTDKLLRVIVDRGAPHEPIWDQHVRGLVARIGDRGGISFSAVGRQRGGGRGTHSFVDRALSHSDAGRGARAREILVARAIGRN